MQPAVLDGPAEGFSGGLRDPLELFEASEPDVAAGATVLEVAQAWSGVLTGVRHFSRDDGPVVVTEDGAGFAPAGRGGTQRGTSELFDCWQGEWSCRFRSGWTGHLETPHARIPLEQLVRSGTARPAGDGTWRVVLDPDSRLVLHTGCASFLARLVRRESSPATRLQLRLDVPLLGVVFVTALSLAVFVLSL